MRLNGVMSFHIPTDEDSNNRYTVSDIKYGYAGTTETILSIATASFSYSRSSQCLEIGDPQYGIRLVTFTVNGQGLKSVTNGTRFVAYEFNRIYGEK